MGVYYLSESGLRDFLEALTLETEVYSTVEREESVRFEGLKAEDVKLVTLRTVRCHASPKSLLFPMREKVAAYSTAGGAGESEPEEPQRVIVGLRQCDLAAIRILDRVFLEGEYVDPFYKSRRESTTLISTDCAEAAESCFCTMVGGKPYLTEGYDLNLTPLKDGYVAETGSEKGDRLVQKYSRFFVTATQARIDEREQSRAAMKKKVEEQNEKFKPERPLQEALAGKIDEKAWQKIANNCVECGACTNICPTCHCFLLYDRLGRDKGKFERLRAWDSCVFGEYWRMAGVGGMKPNPKPEFRSRFANRFFHKFLYQYDMFRTLGCVGCGRCKDACLGGIDPRDVIKQIGKKDKNE
jgi:ferredoxin